jgi:hypothetical protein
MRKLFETSAEVKIKADRAEAKPTPKAMHAAEVRAKADRAEALSKAAKTPKPIVTD